MSKADIEDASRLIPIHASEYQLLGFKWNWQFYYDAALSMGASASCQLIESFSTSLQWKWPLELFDLFSVFMKK